ncbi:MAG: peptide ABC transporter substrate-binding protein [Chromatiales bacterium]|nr:peptide ABC transporter substrate-binding protein [Chromatiales bacterium]
MGAVLAAALFTAGCGPAEQRTAVPIGGASGAELAERQVFRRGNGAEPETLDPHRATSVTAGNIARDLFEGLTEMTPDGSVKPAAAESWTISEDSLVYTFRLRSGARWSNGDPVTAGDWLFSLRRAVDPATLSDYAAILYPIEGARAIVAGEAAPDTLGVQALDEQTLEIRLAAPTPYFLGLLTHSMSYPVHPPSVERHGERYARAGNLVSNGAYQLTEWVVQSHIRAVRNPYYWNDAETVINEVWYYPIDNQDAELRRYRTGELDMTEKVSSRQVDWIQRNLADEFVISPYFGTYYYGLNVTRAPFQGNRELRLALSMAIDRDVITERISGTGEIPAYSWVPPIPGYTQQLPEWAGWTQAEREAEARRLFEQSGHAAESPLVLELIYNTDDNHRRLATAIASMWQEVLGVETRLSNQEWKVFLQTRRERRQTQVFRSGWIGDYLDAFTFTELLHSTYGLNDTGYASERYDELVDTAALEADPARRRALLEEAERVLIDDHPIIPLYFYVTARLVKPWVGGYVPNIMDQHYTKNLYILKH